MQSIPTLSLVMNPDDWFGEGTSGTNGIQGIYVNPIATNNTPPTVTPDREVSVELINPNGSPGFQINASIKMHGGGVVSPPKKSPSTVSRLPSAATTTAQVELCAFRPRR